MARRWWCDEAAVEERARRALRRRLAGRPEWWQFLQQRWSRKWPGWLSDYREDLELSHDESAAERVLEQLVEWIVAWVADYFCDDPVTAEPGAPPMQPVRPEPSPALDRYRLTLERALARLESDPQVVEVRRLFGRLTPGGVLDVLASPLLARWGLRRWLAAGIPVVHRAERVYDLATREAYWLGQLERLVAVGWSVESARAVVLERSDQHEVYRVVWDGGETLVAVPRAPDVEVVWAVPARRWVLVPIQNRADLPPHWRPWAKEVGGRVVVPVELPVAVVGSPLGVLYRAAAGVMRALGCPPGPALLFLLCGAETFTPELGWSAVFGSWTHATNWVELRVLAGLPRDAVVEAYQQACQRAARWVGSPLAPARPVGPRTLALAEFWSRRAERDQRAVSFEALRREWNAAYPQWRYEHPASFWRALRSAVQRVYRVSLPKRCGTTASE